MREEIDASIPFKSDITDSIKPPNPDVDFIAFVKFDRRPVNPPRFGRLVKRPPRPGKVDNISVIPDS